MGRREKGNERQYTHSCKSCSQVVAYQSSKHGEELKLLYVAETAVKVPWHRKKAPWTCKICGCVCVSSVQLQAHKRQRQHFWDEAEEERKRQDDRQEMAPIIVG